MTLPSFRLDEQTALVTGAASGIGRGIALGLAAAGANVASFDLPESGLDEVCGEIREAGRGAIAVPGRRHGCRHAGRCGPGRGERIRPIDPRRRQRRNRQRCTGRGDVPEPVAASDRHQRDRTVSVLPGGEPGHAWARPRRDREHRVDVRIHRQPRAATGSLQRLRLRLWFTSAEVSRWNGPTAASE